MNLICKNMSRYRTQNDYTIDQVCIFAGVDKKTYEDMELGLSKPTRSVLERLAAVYKIDIMDFNSEVITAPTKQATKVVANDAQASSPVFTSKLVNFILLGLVALGFVWFFVIPLTAESVTLGGITGTIKIYAYELFEYSGITLFSAIMLVISFAYLLPNTIVILSSKKAATSGYGYVSKILTIVFAAMAFISLLIVSIDANTLLSYAYASLWLAVLATAIVNLVAKENTGTAKAPKQAKVRNFKLSLNLVLKILAGALAVFLVYSGISYIITLSDSSLALVATDIMYIIFSLIVTVLCGLAIFAKTRKNILIYLGSSVLITLIIIIIEILTV